MVCEITALWHLCEFFSLLVAKLKAEAEEVQLIAELESKKLVSYRRYAFTCSQKTVFFGSGVLI